MQTTIFEGTHSHVMVGDITTNKDMTEIEIKEDVELIHEEHETLDFVPGNYKHSGVVEEDQITKQMRPVFD